MQQTIAIIRHILSAQSPPPPVSSTLPNGTVAHQQQQQQQNAPGTRFEALKRNYLERLKALQVSLK